MANGDASMAELGVRLIASLAVVVGLLLLVARMVNRRYRSAAGATVTVVCRQALSRSTGVAVVSVGTRVLVLGTTEQQVTLLAEVEPDEIGLEDEDPEPQDGAPRPLLRTKFRPVATTGPLAGSILSPQTWKQTLAAFGVPASRAEPEPEREQAS